MIVFEFSIFAQCKIGSPAPDFSLKTFDDSSFQLSQTLDHYDYSLLYFFTDEDSNDVSTVEDSITFLKHFQPKEHCQIIVINNTELKEQEKNEAWQTLTKATDIPMTVLWDENGTVKNTYQIEDTRAIVLLQDDLTVKEIYDDYSSRQEKRLYQYLGFILPSQKEEEDNACHGGVCPPPPGY